jgi:hypothetical protein
MRIKDILPPKKTEEQVTETSGALSPIPGRSFTPDNSRKAQAKRKLNKVLADTRKA